MYWSLLALLPMASPNALDPQADQAYKLQVVLRFSEHRLMTPLFKETVEDDIRTSLTSAFSEIAKVEVVHEHPLLKDVNSVESLADVLQRWKGQGDVKTHFIFIDYVDGSYRIESWQHDGSTGHITNMVRPVETAERQMVGRVVSQTIARDFAPVGTIVERKNNDTVRVVFRGGKGHGEVPNGWAHTGELLSVIPVVKNGGDESVAALRWTLLRVDKVEGGECSCRLFSSIKEPLDAGADVLGYRCVPLATARSTVSLRILQQGTREPAANLAIRLGRRSFDLEERDAVQGVTDRDGYFRSADRDPKPFDNLALVTISGSDNQTLARYPFAVTGTDTVVLALDLDGGEDDPLRLRRGLWEDSLYRGIRKQNGVFRDLKELAKAGQHLKAMERADRELEALRQDLEQFGSIAADLRKGGKGKLDLNEGEQRLAELSRGVDELRGFIQREQAILDREKDPKRKAGEENVQQGQLLEREAEFGMAIDLYQAAIDGGLDDAKLRAHLDDLKKRWACKDASHQRARDFIYQTWPQFDEAALARRIEEVREAFKVCREAGDSLTPRKILRVALDHLGRVKERLGKLNPDEREKERKAAEVLGEDAQGLARLIREVGEFLER